MSKFELFISVVYSLYYNIIIFGFRGFSIPVLFRYNTKIRNVHRGCIQLRKHSRGIVSIGFGGNTSTYSRKNRVDFQKGTIVFNGSAQFSDGVLIKNKGKLMFGDGFAANKNCTFSCTDYISFDDNCLLGWNIHIRDSDGHTIVYNGQEQVSVKPVVIGKHVWIASECHILKGSYIPDNCVVGYKSLVNRKFKEEDCIIAGHPATIVRHNIIWKK